MPVRLGLGLDAMRFCALAVVDISTTVRCINVAQTEGQRREDGGVTRLYYGPGRDEEAVRS